MRWKPHEGLLGFAGAEGREAGEGPACDPQARGPGEAQDTRPRGREKPRPRPRPRAIRTALRASMHKQTSMFAERASMPGEGTAVPPGDLIHA